MIRWLVLGIMGFALISCSHLPKKYRLIHNNSSDYTEAETSPPLKIPAGYEIKHDKQSYPVPNPTKANANKNIELAPPDLDPATIPREKKYWFPDRW